MSQPVLLLWGTDEKGKEYSYDITAYVAEEGLKPTNNGMDADGAGRDILTGYMYRSMICQKQKWTVELIRIDQTVMAKISTLLAQEYLDCTMIDFLSGESNKRNYYNNTFTCGTQRYIGGEIVYDGCTFDLIER